MQTQAIPAAAKVVASLQQDGWRELPEMLSVLVRNGAPTRLTTTEGIGAEYLLDALGREFGGAWQLGRFDEAYGMDMSCDVFPAGVERAKAPVTYKTVREPAGLRGEKLHTNTGRIWLVWYDRNIRLWTCFEVDAAGHQLCAAQYDGIKQRLIDNTIA